jgi:hypothetical protein
MKLVNQRILSIGDIDMHDRAESISFYNPENAQPYMSVVETSSAVIGINGVNIESERNTYNVPYNQGDTIPLLNPITGESTGESINTDYLYAMLYSLYIYAREYNEND